MTWESRTPTAPALASRSASGSLRYIDAVQIYGRRFLYFETARVDGAHELRVIEQLE